MWFRSILCFVVAAASSYDFEESLQTVKFLPKQSTATVYIKIRDDSKVETTEAFHVEILLPYYRYTYLQGSRLGSPSRANVYIEDGMPTNRSKR